jgi:hypothetical protein
MPYIADLKNKLLKLWDNGFTNYRKIKNVKNVGAYMCKYMTKEINNPRLYGQKCYFSSRGLKKPIVKNDQSVIDFVLNFLPKSTKTYENIFPSDYCKCIHYRQYDLSKEQDLKNSLLAFIK